MPRTTNRTRRVVLATAAAAVLPVGAASALAAGGASPNPGGAASTARALASPAMAAGSESTFFLVAPCRVLDTRVAGGRLTAASRGFTATGSYGPQGGKPGGCGIPSYATAVQLNLGAISQSGTKGFVKGWASGTPEPNASLVNYDPSGAVANMVTLPISAGGGFILKTNASAHLFADVAGYYAKPLYATVTPGGAVYAGISSGVVSTTRTGVGAYSVRFERNVRKCAVTTSDVIFSGSRDISVDNGFDPDTDTVTIRVTNSANNAEDTYFTVSAAC
ncbi:MAG TPA: hypothetical protein VES95_08755 [Dermatophilaceae bacterium]|nr:hypothetical protein [Dermatophilaceae bacterium]